MGDIRKQLEIMKSGVGPNYHRRVDKEGERYDSLWVDRISGALYIMGCAKLVTSAILDNIFHDLSLFFSSPLL